jgi:cystathionine gamma-synthase
MTTNTLKPETLAAQALGWIEATTRAVVPPVHPATTFERAPDNTLPGGRSYGRAQSPAFDQAEALLSALEGGAGAMLFASGMAAATAVFQSLRPGDHVLLPEVMYWSLRRWVLQYCADWGMTCDLVDMSKLDALRRAVQPGRTKLVWLETPSNPMWGVTDIAGAAEIAHAAGARVAIDSTAATPVLTRPIALGADIVMHSATKYLNGHSDVVAGALVTARTDEHWARLAQIRNDIGGILGPFEAWLMLRGMRTLYVRVRQASASAMAVAAHFHRHPKLKAVLYPGLPDHPGHAVAARQMEGGFGGMLSIRTQGAAAEALAVAGRLQLWKRATSLGGVESLVEHRASIEPPGSPVPPDLLRLSVGLENADDLIADLAQALQAI